MIVVAGNNAINLENVSRLSLAVSSHYGWGIDVTFDNPTKYYLAFTVIDGETHPEVRDLIKNTKTCFRNSGKRVGYVLGKWLMENAKKDEIITLYRMTAEILRMFGGKECLELADFLLRLDEEERKRW